MDWMTWALVGGAVLGVVLAIIREIKFAKFPELRARRRGKTVLIDPDVRTREVISESLDIAMRTKRRATAESRLQVAEDVLDDLAERGVETLDDRVDRHTLNRLREGLDRRFPVKPRKKAHPNGAES